MNEQRVSFRNELSDMKVYLDFYTSTPEGRRYGKRIFFINQILLFVLAAGTGAFFLWLVRSFWPAAAFALAVFLLGECITLLRSDFQPSVFYARLGMKRALRQWNQREKEVFLLSKECHITPEGFSIRHQFAEHFWKWETIERVVALPGFLVIQTGAYVFLIPQRDFESAERFEEFARAVHQFHQEKQETPALEEGLRAASRPSSPRLPKFLQTAVIILLVLVSCALMIVISLLFPTKVPSSDAAQALLDEYMRAMQAQHTMQALSCFSEPTKTQKALLDKQMQGVDLARYAGYETLEIEYFEAGAIPGGAQATVIARVHYQSQNTGLLYARLDSGSDEWKIDEIWVYLSPQEVEQFLQSASR